MLDSDLARLYGVSVKRLNEQVKRNIGRFPPDFMFSLNNQEVSFLRSQNATSNKGRGGRRYSLYAFTEYGVAMLSSVLKSEKAIQVNIEIMRAFGRLREMIQSNKALAEKIARLEEKYDTKFKAVFDAIFKLMEPPPSKPKHPIGFRISDAKSKG